MGDKTTGDDRGAQKLDIISYKYQNKEGRIGGSAYKGEEAFEKYKIRLISWECVPPIENNFK